MFQSSQAENTPARPVIALRVFRQQPGATDHVRLLSPCYGGCFVHWVKGRSEYCDPEGCTFGCPKVRKVWKGYGAADVWDAVAKLWRPVCFELSEALELDFRDKWRRGQVWRVVSPIKRKGKNEAKFAQHVESHPENLLPAEFNFIPCLLNTYHVYGINLSIKNPLPPRVLVEAVAGPAPGEQDHNQNPASSEQLAEFGRRAKLLGNIGRMPSGMPKNGTPRPAEVQNR